MAKIIGSMSENDQEVALRFPPVVRMGSLSEWVRFVTGSDYPATRVGNPVAFLTLTRKPLPNYGVPDHEVMLTLAGQGPNGGPIATVMHSARLWLAGGGSKQDQSIHAGFHTERDLVKAWLIEHHFTVYMGTLAIPTSLPDVKGAFDIVVWEKGADGLFTVRLAAPGEEEDTAVPLE